MAHPLARHPAPGLARGVMAGVLLAFARALGEFGATLMLADNIPGRINIMPLAIYSAFMGGDLELANWLVVLHTCIAVAALFLAQRAEARS